MIVAASSRAGRFMAALWAALMVPGVRAAEPAYLKRFDPEAWLRERKQGPLTVSTPQSGRDVTPIQATTLTQWLEERKLYEAALRELLGPWPQMRPQLHARILEQKTTLRWTRYKVAYSSLASDALHASEVRAWMFVPAKLIGPGPAIICLHQTVEQGKDEPAGVKATLPWMAYATYYAERGYVTLAPDAIGYGERSRGGFKETGFELMDAWPILKKHPQLSLLGLMLFDVSRAVDYLESRPEVDRKRIGVIGHSQGGFLTNFIMPLEPRIVIGVASCGYGLFRTDSEFHSRWVHCNSAYLPRLYFYRDKPRDLPIEFHQIMAMAAPRAHLVQTALGDTIWTLPGVARDTFIAGEIRKVRSLYGPHAVDNFVSIQPGGGATDKNHGWYPEAQEAADRLFAKVLKNGRRE